MSNQDVDKLNDYIVVLEVEKVSNKKELEAFKEFKLIDIEVIKGLRKNILAKENIIRTMSKI